MMLRDENDGKQKKRRILCGRKDSSMQSENLSGNTNQAVYKHSFSCIHLDFPLFPNSPCTDLQPGENRQHHILRLISPCRGKCSTISEACQGFRLQLLPSMLTNAAVSPLRSKITPCKGSLWKAGKKTASQNTFREGANAAGHSVCAGNSPFHCPPATKTQAKKA